MEKTITKKFFRNQKDCVQNLSTAYYDRIKEEILDLHTQHGLFGTKNDSTDTSMVKSREICSSKDIFELLEIDLEQQLSVLSGILDTNDLFRFCFDEDNFKTKNNSIKYAIYYEYIKKSEIIQMQTQLSESDLNYLLTNGASNKITRLKYGYTCLLLMEIDKINVDFESFPNSFRKWIEKEITNDDTKIITKFEKLSFHFFNNHFKMIKVNRFSDIIESIKNTFKSEDMLFQIDLEPLFESLPRYYNVDEVIEKVKNVWKPQKYLEENIFTEIELERINRIKNKLKDMVLDIRKGARSVENLVSNTDLQNEIEKIIKKFETIKKLESIGIKYLPKGFNKVNNCNDKNVIYFCFDNDLKQNKEDIWEAKVGQIINRIIYTKDTVVVAYDYDLHCDDGIENKSSEIGLFKIDKNKFIELSIFTEISETYSGNKNDYENMKESETDINIILLGESGVGKSTFVNSIFNYLKFKSFQEAKQKGYELIIPTQFTYTDNEMKMHDIKAGEDNNECFIVGQSSTQVAKAHVMQVRDTKIRIIDTPGIGDSRGIETDKKNFRQTVEYVSKFDHLNAICFLLKPNNVRFQQVFKYCFKELLSNLHKNTTKNIIFCFTNSRNTQYRPGESLPALKRFLNEIKETSNVEIPIKYENTFCLDNEAFRYLLLTDAKYSRIVDIDQAEEKNYANSWKKSSEESKRMFDYLKGIHKIKTKEIIFLNKSKHLIMDWTKPTISALIELLTSFHNCQLALNDLKPRTQLRTPNRMNYESDRFETKANKLCNIISDIISKCATLTSYIRQNAVSVFNDDFLAQLDEVIREQEEMEYRLNKSQPLLIHLKEVRLNYNHAILNDQISEKWFQDRQNELFGILENYKDTLNL